ncbi:CGNR zinc finger domain-containing protein [Streptomyces sp. SD15]
MNDRAPAPGSLALIQSLVNTLDIESGADSLDTPEGRAHFGLATAGAAGVTAGVTKGVTKGVAEEVAAARELRESLRVACLAHAGHPPHRTVTPLGELLARSPLRVTVDEHDGSAGFAPAAVSLTSTVAAAVAEALVAGTWQRLKACEAPTCHWVYYDRSPGGRGRWCSMSVCGARAKMRRYRAK